MLQSINLTGKYTLVCKLVKMSVILTFFYIFIAIEDEIKQCVLDNNAVVLSRHEFVRIR